jgi:hypothetical protein
MARVDPSQIADFSLLLLSTYPAAVGSVISMPYTEQ